MRRLVFLGNGSFGTALMQEVTELLGPLDNAWGLDTEDLESFRQNFNSICNTVRKDDSLLLLADRQNSSALKEAWLVLEKRAMLRRTMIVSGINVPGALAAARYRDEIDSDQQLFDTIRAEFQAGLQMQSFQL